MAVACPWSDYGCHKSVPYAERKTHVKSEFIEHAFMRFEWDNNEKEEWREQYEDDKKEIHNKLESIDNLNLKENLEHVKFLATLVENQSAEIEELKNENKQILVLKKEINELRDINDKQNEEINKLKSLNDMISKLSIRIDKITEKKKK
eukprot:716116_1